MSNQITTTQLGVYSVATSICMIFLTILTAGLPLIISRTTAESELDKNYKRNHQTITAGIVFSIILSILVVSFIVFFKPFFALIFADSTSYTVLLTLIPFLVSSGLYAPIKGFLWGKEDYFSVSIVELFEQIIKIIICVILFTFASNPNLPAGLSMSISCVCSTILGFIIYFKKGGKLSNPKRQLKPVFKSSMPITAIRVAGSLLQPLISIILPLRLVSVGYTNAQAMSELGIVMGMTFPLLTIPTTLIGSLAMALTPKLTVLQKQNDNLSLKSQINNSIKFTLFCCFLFVPIFFALGIPMCELLFNNSSSGLFLQNYSWVVIVMGLCQITTSVLNSLGQEKFVFYSYFASAFAIILCIIILPKYVGISSLLIGLGMQNLVVSIINLIKIKKLLKSSTTTTSLIFKFSFISIVLSLITKWLFNVLSIYFSDILIMFILGFFTVFSFVLLCYALEIINIQMYIQKKKQTNKV